MNERSGRTGRGWRRPAARAAIFATAVLAAAGLAPFPATLGADEPAGTITVSKGSSGCPGGAWFTSAYSFDANDPDGVTVVFHDVDLYAVNFADPTTAPFEAFLGLTSATLTNEGSPPDNSVWVSIGHNACGSGTSAAPCYSFGIGFDDPTGGAETAASSGAWNQEVKGGPITGTNHLYDTFDVSLEVKPFDASRYRVVAKMLRKKAAETGNAARAGSFETLLPSPATIGTPSIDLRRVQAFIGLHFSQCSGVTDLDSTLNYGKISISGNASVPELRMAVPGVLGPVDPVVAHLILTTSLSDTSAAGARLTYDAAKFRLDGVSQVVKGAGLPPSWDFVYRDIPSAGQVDLVVTDLTPTAATIAGPVKDLELARITFSRIGVNCAEGVFGFSAIPPDAGKQARAFPSGNWFIAYNDPVTHKVKGLTAHTTPGSGPHLTDHGFIRGNVNNRGAHRLDLSDVVDLAAILFSGFPPIPCAAAMDVDDNGSLDIFDLVNLLQGIFNPEKVKIAPPNAVLPGPGLPGVGVPNLGAIPSTLGCDSGETCP